MALVEGGERERPLRADAQRNRERILAAAEEVFSREGLGAPIDKIAEQAGVGVGTLYRHFPTKEALLQAIVLLRLDQLVELSGRLADSPRPTEALFSYLETFASVACAKHDLMEALGSAGIDIKVNCAATFEMLMGAIDILVSRAIEEGGVRPDVSAKEVVALVVGSCQASNLTADGPRLSPLLHIVFDGLRTH